MALPDSNKSPGDLGHTADHNLITEEISNIKDDYLSSSVASSTYLRQDSASTIYLTQSDASDIYFPRSASGGLLTEEEASGIYIPLTSSVLFDYVGSASAAEFNAKAYTDSEISDLINAAPPLLDTLNELAAALGDDPNFAASTASAIGDRLTKASASTIYLTISDASDTYFPRSASGGLLTEDEAAGIYLRQDSASANVVTYDNSDAYLSSTNVKGALDELSLGKADIGSLSSNIILYSTSASSDVSSYFKLVTSTDDPDYNTASVAIPTGAITGSSQFLSALVSASGILVGNPGVVGITTIGNIAKTAGNTNNYAEFYFEVYKRDSGGTETLLGTSDTTGQVNPGTLDQYFEFSATSLVNFVNFVDSDRISIKYYGRLLAGAGPEYSFKFGGENPVRTLLPVPVSVIPVSDASGIVTDTSTFNNNLSGSDTTVQAALETIDNIDLSVYLTSSSAALVYATLESPTFTGTPSSVTPGSGDSSTNIATTEFVQNAIIGAVSGSIDLSAYLTLSVASATYLSQTDASSTYLTQSTASSIYATLDSPNLLGIPTSITASAGNNTTQIATTEFVSNAIIDGGSP